MANVLVSPLNMYINDLVRGPILGYIKSLVKILLYIYIYVSKESFFIGVTLISFLNSNFEENRKIFYTFLPTRRLERR